MAKADIWHNFKVYGWKRVLVVAFAVSVWKDTSGKYIKLNARANIRYADATQK